ARSLKNVILFHSSLLSLEQYLHYCLYLNRHVQDEVLLTYESFRQLYTGCNEVTSPHQTPEQCSVYCSVFASLIIQDYYMQMLVHYDVLLAKIVYSRVCQLIVLNGQYRVKLLRQICLHNSQRKLTHYIEPRERPPPPILHHTICFVNECT